MMSGKLTSGRWAAECSDLAFKAGQDSNWGRFSQPNLHREGPIGMIDYYEFLQISPNADLETIQRVYRFLAARLHPDNSTTGDPEMFRLLKSAYDVLSDPARRSEYDATCRRDAPQPDPLSAEIDFMDHLDGEMNRRLAVLALLYFQRRSNPRFPEVPLAEVERRMGFPRDYLDFTTWYLQKKGYIARADNSDFTLTADGVDYIEAQRMHLPVLNRLLTDGSKRSRARSSESAQSSPRTKPITVPSRDVRWTDRRSGASDRRSGIPDHRYDSFDRRSQRADRRVNTTDRRLNTGDRRSHGHAGA
jgi:curved DNA-binding protein CbpA